VPKTRPEDTDPFYPYVSLFSVVVRTLMRRRKNLGSAKKRGEKGKGKKKKKRRRTQNSKPKKKKK